MSHQISTFASSSTYVVLEENGSVIPISVSDRFYEDLLDRDWDSWEMHPDGDEVVCLLSGQVDFILEQDGTKNSVRLNTPGDYISVPRGTWHTAKVYIPSSILFVTPGQGTQCRPL